MVNAPALDRRWTLAEAIEELRKKGIMLQSEAGGYRLNLLRGGTPQTEYVTDDLVDALVRGFAMAAEPPARPLLRRRWRWKPGRKFFLGPDGTARKRLRKKRRLRRTDRHQPGGR